jgi:hypothetical protein
MMLMQRINAYGVYHQGAQSDAMQKGERNQLSIQAPGSSSFSDIHNFSEEDCQADQWEKPFENLVVLHQMLFASVNRTLSASVRLSPVITLVLAVLFPCTFDSVLDCAVTEEKKNNLYSS